MSMISMAMLTLRHLHLTQDGATFVVVDCGILLLSSLDKRAFDVLIIIQQNLLNVLFLIGRP